METKWKWKWRRFESKICLFGEWKKSENKTKRWEKDPIEKKKVEKKLPFKVSIKHFIPHWF